MKTALLVVVSSPCHDVFCLTAVRPRIRKNVAASTCAVAGLASLLAVSADVVWRPVAFAGEVWRLVVSADVAWRQAVVADAVRAVQPGARHAVAAGHGDGCGNQLS